MPVPLGPEAVDILTSVSGGEPWQGDFVVTRADGVSVPVHVVDSPIVDERGEIVGVVGVGRNISAQLQTQRALHESRDALRVALRAGRLGMWRWDMSTGEVEWDEQLEALFGLPPGGFDGSFDMYESLLHPDDRPRVLAVVQDAVASKSDYDVDHRVVWPDGSVHWSHGRGSVTLASDGTVTGTVGCVGDITDRMLQSARTTELSASLQAGLLPKLASPPNVVVRSRYRPGEERLLLGGDFLDVAVTPAGHVGFCIGDVAGHGAVPAAVGASLRAGWRALALTTDSPDTWLVGCARLLAAGQPPPELFVTMATGLVSADGRHLRVLTAGHPPPIVLTYSGATTLDVEVLPPLGLLRIDDVMVADVVELPERSSLLMFTDGLFEGYASPGSIERLGVEAVEEWCRSLCRASLEEHDLDDLLALVESANGAPMVDDVAVLVLCAAAGRAKNVGVL